MKAKVALLSCVLLTLACGAAKNKVSTTAEFTYALARTFTGEAANSLILSYPEGTGYQFIITGDGFSADVDLDTWLPLQERVSLSYPLEGRYTLDFALAQADGTLFLSDSLSWTYSTGSPLAPIVSFTENATADTAVTMTIAGTRDLDTNEILVEGDVSGSHAAGGYWDSLSPSGLYVLNVSAEDGIKTMTVKLRNIYGNESPATTVSILKKSTPPSNCRVDLAGAGAASSTIKAQIFASNNGPLFYNVYGDVKTVTNFTQFSSGDFVDVDLSGGAGEKNLTFAIADLAGNQCSTIDKTVNLESGYDALALSIVGQPYWTNANIVNLAIRYDHFPSAEPVEMKLTGNITGDNVETWIPYQTTLPVQLMPTAGDKRIYVQFRDNTLTETFLVSTRIFLQPALSITTAQNGSKNIIISRIIGATGHTITGCQESYQNVAYSSAYACTPTAATAQLTYYFSDAEPLTLSSSF